MTIILVLIGIVQFRANVIGIFPQSKHNNGSHNYLYISPVCHPSSQLLCCKASDLQLIGVSLARFPFGWEVEECRSRIHAKLQHIHRKYSKNTELIDMHFDT